MQMPAEIGGLIERFDRNIESYKAPGYKEAQLRAEFIDPFFEALGWDVRNTEGVAEAYKDVIHEDAIRIGGATKAPDYCFRIGPMRKFFVEAKKPSVPIKAEVKGKDTPAYQLRRYAWSAKLPLSILTDFEEFAVYDCRIRPNPNDTASKARIIYCTYEDYADRWNEIAGVFSKKAVLRGSFDKYAETARGKRGASQVDTEFLKEIEGWRELLARNIALRNPRLSVRQLNFAVQRTIDRIIFLRMAEDRGIETYAQLRGLLNGTETYARLRTIYDAADKRYNSGLFHFQKEKGREEPPDEVTPSLKIDDKVLKEIFKHLYYPDSPYEFSVLGGDILGNVYEQFLGKVIRLTKGHRARVEEKPEVKKAGGVYYTPSYIVDYIVKNTVGKLCDGKTPRQVSKLRILDPACGSGSFLIGAYTCLLDWHRDWYYGDGPEKHRNKIYQGMGGQWYLTTKEKKRILLDNIYGVDIDGQAVEVTKLNLLLKLLEGENQDTLTKQFQLFGERALPDLASNIKCGNSLIGPDFYEQHQFYLFDDEERYRINVFDWQSAFPKIFKGKNPGFDAVIGNPPWLMAGYYVDDTALRYMREIYESATGKFDMYYLFLEKTSNLIGKECLFGMIVPNKFFHTKAGKSLRKLLSERQDIFEIVDFGSEQLFAGATNYSVIVLGKKGPSRDIVCRRALSGLKIKETFKIAWAELVSDEWILERQEITAFLNRIAEENSTLEEVVTRFGTGVQSGADKILALTLPELDTHAIKESITAPMLRGRDVKRYESLKPEKFLIFPYRKDQSGNFRILSTKELQKDELCYKYLWNNKEKLSKRRWFGKNAVQLSGKWYGMMYLDSARWFETPHLLTPCLSDRANFTIDQNANLFATGTAGVMSIVLGNTKEDQLYVLGLLNSKLLETFVKKNSPTFSGGFFKFSSPYLKKLPIRRISFSDPADKARHDRMVKLVNTMLELNKKLQVARTPDEKVMIQRQIDATDKRIDMLVYELYGLTDEEIAIVEEATAKS